MKKVRQIASFPLFLLSFLVLVLAAKVGSGKTWKQCIHRTFHCLDKGSRKDNENKKREKKETLADLKVDKDYDIGLTQEEVILGQGIAQLSQHLNLSRRETLTALSNISREVEKILTLEEAEACLRTGR